MERWVGGREHVWLLFSALEQSEKKVRTLNISLRKYVHHRKSSKTEILELIGDPYLPDVFSKQAKLIRKKTILELVAEIHFSKHFSV